MADYDVFCGPWSAQTDPDAGLHRGASTTSLGCPFKQLPDEYPFLAPLYTSFELDFDALPVVRWAAREWALPLAISAGYLLFCVVGQRLMASAKSIKSRKVLAAWNLLLAVFSAVGFLRTAPHLLNFAGRHGLYASICAPAETAYGHGAAGLWMMLFVFSKVPELIDTVFIVLGKRKLIFLHWYHHFTVLLYCWHSYATRSSAGIYFAVMNYGVHSVMYFYYFLTANGYKPSWDWIVTTLQISQMFLGIAICVAVSLYRRAAVPCDMTDSNYAAGLVMYGSYALLFVLFAFERYVLPLGGSAKAAKGAKSA